MNERIESEPADGGGERHLRLRVDLVMEVTDGARVIRAALEQIAADEYLPEPERAHAQAAARADEAEALAYLVDPFDLVGAVPGVELVQASWHSAHTDYDPEDPARSEEP